MATRPLLFLLVLVAILALTWWVYHPGLAGDFLFDDFANLPAIGATGPVTHWATFWRYITSGTADPTGRPLTLLTFLIDARNWPASPYPFKVTNVILHLINGALLAWVLWWLGTFLARGSATSSFRTPRSGDPESVARVYAGRSLDDAAGAKTDSGFRPAAGPGMTNEVGAAGPGMTNEVGAAGHGMTNEVGAAGHGMMNEVGAAGPGMTNEVGAAGPGMTNEVGAAGPGMTNEVGAAGPGMTNEVGAAGPGMTNEVGAAGPGMTNEVGAAGPGMTNEVGAAGPGMTIDRRGYAIAALFGAGAWLLHPLLVSTTLYIVQREAMLPATFVLIGMLGWMASREALANGHVKRALAGMALSAWLCTLLAVLCKANGALLPLLLLLAEWIVLSRRPMPSARTQRRHRRAVAVFLVLPSVLVIAYLLYLLPRSLAAPIADRGWSAGQRLLTEPRVVTDYLRLLFIPHAHSTGLFNDQFAISKNWLHPASTLPCIALILVLIGAGFALRKKYPAIALALLFYFAAQLMESGWIPLELYFEHRNYLPAMLLFWPIGLWLGRPGSLRFLRVGAAVLILAVLATLTLQRATLWGDGFRQAQVWAAINPDSARAQANAALYDMQHDRPRLAAARLRLSLPRHPDDIQAPINLIGAECKLGAVQPQTLARAEFALAHTRVGGQAAFTWFNEALDMASHHVCSGLDFAALQATLDAARRNPHWQDQPGRQQDLDHLQGQLDLAEGNPDAALQAFNRALAASSDPGAALQQAAYLGAHGYPRLGLDHLDYFDTLPPGPKPGVGMPRIHAWVLRKQGWWETETAYLRRTLVQDAKAKAAKDTSGT